jgi:uncharacterized membrane protein YbhN (UPF0104 family)
MPTSHFRPNRRYLIFVGLFVIGLYVILPQVGNFKSSWGLLRHPDIGWTLLAIIFTLGTYLAAATTYVLLAFKRLAYLPTVVVQFAAMFINRLLPVGIGALGANYSYLTKNEHSASQAATTVAVNNLLGFVGHNLLVLIMILVWGGNEALGSNYGHSLAGFLKIVVPILVIVLLMAVLIGRRRVLGALAAVEKQLLSYKQRPFNLLGALLSSMALTSFNVLCLYACSLALGVHLSFVVVLLIFTVGVGAGSVSPTPGGLGGFEAGLVAGFLAYRVDSSSALAIALLFRLISYWLTLVIGAFALIAAQRRHYI